MKIALISCSKEKKNYSCPAHELYSASTLFSLSYKYAKQYADKVYILSAKYGLVDENCILEPYDMTLNEMNHQHRMEWAKEVHLDLKKNCEIESDTFIFLTGNNYYKDLLQYIPNYSLPLAGLRMGERMAYLKKMLSNTEQISVDNMCDRLHKLFCSMQRYAWNDISQIPFDNGIYIVFEKDEEYHDMERIVRVGTHTASNRLKMRLKNHFINENHDGSIFRKNIGKAILNADNDPYLGIWTMDTSKFENHIYADKDKNADVERKVSKLLRDNFTFTVFEVIDKDERLRMEEAIIATMNHDQEFVPGSNWLGLYSPNDEIRRSGLWLKRGLNGEQITETEFNRLLELCGKNNAYTINNSMDCINKSQSVKKDLNRCGKYELLLHFFKEQTSQYVVLTFDELEEILGFKLPKSAYVYSEWWSPNGHHHCQAWLQSGYDVINIKEGICNKKITFYRKKLP